MVERHILLTILWTAFGVLHSLLAAAAVKKQIERFAKHRYKFYRLSYSLLALVTLVAVLWYHFTIDTVMLWHVNLAEQIIAMAGIAFGGAVMLLFTRRFFFDLSGADIFLTKQNRQQLIKTDLYKYVRHPLYAATLVLVWSIFLWHPQLNNLISCICISLYTIIGIRFEEKKLMQEFGDSYVQYRSQTPMLIPKIF